MSQYNPNVDEEVDEYETDEHEDYEDEGVEEGEEAQEAGDSEALGQINEADDDEEEDGDEEDDGEDEDEDEDDEEEEEEEEEEEMALPWNGVRTMPERAAVLDIIRDLKASGKKSMTVLLLGKSGVGKSSTINSLLNESVVRVSAFKLQADSETALPVLKVLQLGGDEADGFKLKLIDTCGLEDPEAGDTVNYTALRKIAQQVEGMAIDAVLYLDRLDLYRVEPLDKRMMQAVSDTFGPAIWKKAVIGLTHGNMQQAPPGATFESFSRRRQQLLRGAIRRPLFRPALPSVLIENSETCPRDPSTRHRVLPDEDHTSWVLALYEALADMALAGKAYTYKKGMSRKPGGRFKWLIPAALYGQYLLLQHVLLPQLHDSRARLDSRSERAWQQAAQQRKELGMTTPLTRPNKTDSWRLEAMYDDE